jgi:hypothetical protein
MVDDVWGDMMTEEFGVLDYFGGLMSVVVVQARE